MKKILALVVSVILLALTGCGTSTATKVNSGSKSFELDMTEATFVSMYTEICTNTDKYTGKSIRLDGMYKAATDHMGNGVDYSYVYRNVLDKTGCCNYPRGLELEYADMSSFKDDQWIHVEGTLESYSLDVDGESKTFLKIVASKIEPLSTPGKDPIQG